MNNLKNTDVPVNTPAFDNMKFGYPYSKIINVIKDKFPEMPQTPEFCEGVAKDIEERMSFDFAIDEEISNIISEYGEDIVQSIAADTEKRKENERYRTYFASNASDYVAGFLYECDRKEITPVLEQVLLRATDEEMEKLADSGIGYSVDSYYEMLSEEEDDCE
jgi:hypothetical protein